MDQICPEGGPERYPVAQGGVYSLPLIAFPSCWGLQPPLAPHVAVLDCFSWDEGQGWGGRGGNRHPLMMITARGGLQVLWCFIEVSNLALANLV